MTFLWLFHDFPGFSMTFAVFHDYAGLEYGLPKFYDFPRLSRPSGHPECNGHTLYITKKSANTDTFSFSEQKTEQ